MLCVVPSCFRFEFPYKRHMNHDGKATTAVEKAGATKTVVLLPLSDPEHPNNWSRAKKSLVVALCVLSAFHSTFGSSLPSNAIGPLVEYFHVQGEIQRELPISCFLIGFP